MEAMNGWEPIPDESNSQHAMMLGKGGQGEVCLVRSPQRAEQRRQIDKQVIKLLLGVGHNTPTAFELAKSLIEIGGPDPPECLGAFKRFIIPPENKEEESKAVGRLEAEVKALQALNDHPGILKLLDSSVDGRFIVTQYHERGTLNRHLDIFKGNALAALEAFRPLVDAACRIHQAGTVHRDIKPENIFVSSSGELVLGDFGIVFNQDGSDRLTSTYERVGSHDWMAPWAYKRERLELSRVSPTLDIFPLAKVLWSMIAGENGFAFWEYARDENNLQNRFPYEPVMSLINERIFSTRIVREVAECDSSAQTLLEQVEGLINHIKDVRGFRPDGAEVWPCRICGRGEYRNIGPRYQLKGFREGGPINESEKKLFVSICDHCGHAELFTQ